MPKRWKRRLRTQMRLAHEANALRVPNSSLNNSKVVESKQPQEYFPLDEKGAARFLNVEAISKSDSPTDLTYHSAGLPILYGSLIDLPIPIQEGSADLKIKLVATGGEIQYSVSWESLCPVKHLGVSPSKVQKYIESETSLKNSNENSTIPPSIFEKEESLELLPLTNLKGSDNISLFIPKAGVVTLHVQNSSTTWPVKDVHFQN